jgi:hypothetical protein
LVGILASVRLTHWRFVFLVWLKINESIWCKRDVRMGGQSYFQ